MSLVIPVAHDFTCPWCWIGLHQIRRLRKEFDVEFDWLSYELSPEGLVAPKKVQVKPDLRRPPVPSRIALAYSVEGMDPPTKRPARSVDTNPAFQAAEYAKTKGVSHEFIERVYDAFWTEGAEIDKIDVLKRLAKGIVPDIRAMEKAIKQKKFSRLITPFDEPAYKKRVFYVPTFFIDGEIFPEQTYSALDNAIRKQIGGDKQAGVYPALKFDEPKKNRPYVFMNMISTIDGKTVSGERNEPVMDIGSDIDHKSMRQIEDASDAVMVGAGSLRATKKIWYPKDITRIVVTGSGNVPSRKKFFSEGRAFVATTESGAKNVPENIETIIAGKKKLNVRALLKTLNEEYKIERLLIEGGSELNASLLEKDLVDELFLTIAPKIKLGRDVPTYAGGEPLPREQMLKFKLVSNKQIGDEIFLRYKRDR